MAATVSSTAFSGVTAAVAAGVSFTGAGGAELDEAIFLLFDALVPGALPFDAALPACGAVREAVAACRSTRGRATGPIRSISTSAGTATLVARSSWRRADNAR